MSDHYYSEKQESAFNPFLIPIRPYGLDAYEIYSAGGVFSLKHLDKGTEIMLRYAEVPSEGRVADLGCGYGVVGITLLRQYPKLDMSFIDSSERAIKLTKKNLGFHKLPGFAKVSSIFAKLPDKVFDVILTNPPYSAGRKVCFKFIEESVEHLNSGGSLQLVCRRQKGGDVLEKHMNEVFGNVEVIGQKSGFRLYKSVKS